MTAPLVVVLGASGRVGSRVAAQVRADSLLLRVSRSEDGPGAVRCDVTDPEQRRCCAAAVAAAARPSRELVVVDCVLDRTSVEGMGSSTAGAAALADLLLGEARGGERAARLVVCSTTAVLAPRGLGTPYAAFKRSALRRHASSGGALTALLLPMLGLGTGLPHSPRLSYEEAAEVVAGELKRHPAQKRLLLAPSPVRVDGHRRPRADDLARALRLGARRLTVDRDSPEAHRAASRALLAAIPRAARGHLDHHLAPPGRVRRLAAELRCEIGLLSCREALR